MKEKGKKKGWAGFPSEDPEPKALKQKKLTKEQKKQRFLDKVRGINYKDKTLLKVLNYFKFEKVVISSEVFEASQSQNKVTEAYQKSISIGWQQFKSGHFTKLLILDKSRLSNIGKFENKKIAKVLSYYTTASILLIPEIETYNSVDELNIIGDILHFRRKSEKPTIIVAYDLNSLFTVLHKIPGYHYITEYLGLKIK